MLRNGDIVGNRWEIVEKIGYGTFSEVYLGQNILDQSLVAVKISVNKHQEGSFKSEAEMLQILTDYQSCNPSTIVIPNLLYYGQFSRLTYESMLNELDSVSISHKSSSTSSSADHNNHNNLHRKSSSSSTTVAADVIVSELVNGYTISEIRRLQEDHHNPNNSNNDVDNDDDKDKDEINSNSNTPQTYSRKRKHSDTFSYIFPPIPIHISAGLCITMTKSLTTIHHLDIIHRDVKPSNFMITTTGSDEERVFVLDFGLSKQCCPLPSPSTTSTSSTSFRGSSMYASLSVHSQSRQHCYIDDLVSVSFVLLELICGWLPWSELARNTNNLNFGGKDGVSRRDAVMDMKRRFMRALVATTTSNDDDDDDLLTQHVTSSLKSRYCDADILFVIIQLKQMYELLNGGYLNDGNVTKGFLAILERLATVTGGSDMTVSQFVNGVVSRNINASSSSSSSSCSFSNPTISSTCRYQRPDNSNSNQSNSIMKKMILMMTTTVGSSNSRQYRSDWLNLALEVIGDGTGHVLDKRKRVLHEIVLKLYLRSVAWMGQGQVLNSEELREYYDLQKLVFELEQICDVN